MTSRFPVPVETPSQQDINAFCSAAKIPGDLNLLKQYLGRFGAAIINERDSQQDTALTWAAWTGQKEIVAYLLEQGADINKTGMTGRTAIGWAANGGRREVVELLMDKGANTDLKDAGGSTPADLARNTGHPELADFIRENGTQKRKAAAELAAKEKAEQEGRDLVARRLDALKKHKPPKLKF